MQEQQLSKSVFENLQRDIDKILDYYLSADRLGRKLYKQERESITKLQQVKKDIGELLNKTSNKASKDKNKKYNGKEKDKIDTLEETYPTEKYRDFIISIERAHPGEKIEESGWLGKTLVNSNLPKEINGLIKENRDNLERFKQVENQRFAQNQEAVQSLEESVKEIRKSQETMLLKVGSLENQLEKATSNYNQLALTHEDTTKQLQLREQELKKEQENNKQLALANQNEIAFRKKAMALLSNFAQSSITVVKPEELDFETSSQLVDQLLALAQSPSLPSIKSSQNTSTYKDQPHALFKGNKENVPPRLPSIFNADELYNLKETPPKDKQEKHKWLQKSPTNKTINDGYTLYCLLSHRMRATVFALVDFLHAHKTDNALSNLIQSMIEYLLDKDNYKKLWASNWEHVNKMLTEKAADQTSELRKEINGFSTREDIPDERKKSHTQNESGAPKLLKQILDDKNIFPPRVGIQHTL